MPPPVPAHRRLSEDSLPRLTGEVGKPVPEVERADDEEDAVSKIFMLCNGEADILQPTSLPLCGIQLGEFGVHQPGILNPEDLLDNLP